MLRRCEERLRQRGEREDEGGAGRRGAFGPDAAAVGFDQLLDDGQAEAGAAGGAGARIVDAVEAFEDEREMFGRDAGAAILHADFDFAWPLDGGDRDGACLRASSAARCRSGSRESGEGGAGRRARAGDWARGRDRSAGRRRRRE